MLLPPSKVLEAAGVSDFKTYAMLVYKRALKANEAILNGCGAGESAESMSDYSFAQGVSARGPLYTHVKSRYDASVPDEEDCIAMILPPLFIRSNMDSLVLFQENMHLVFCKDGPVVPVVTRVKHNTTGLLSALVELYGLVSQNFVTKENLSDLLE